MVCKRVVFIGRVQGVGFRFATHSIAGAFRVAGYVRNLPDGTVEVVARGEKAELARFVAEIRRAMGRNIDEVREESFKEPLPASGFEIRY